MPKEFPEVNNVLIFNRAEWQANPHFKWSDEDLDNANKHGFIGSRLGVDCYLARPVGTTNQ